MKVSEIIANALKILGRSKLAEAVEAGETLSGEGAETVKTLLYCYNAAENELAENGFPLVEEENLASVSGNFYFERFSAPVNRILSVKSGEKEVKYELFPLYIRVNAPFITVKYERPPAVKELISESDFGGVAGAAVLSYGVVAEYFLINGEIQSSSLWEERYRTEISRIKRRVNGNEVAPRRWV